MNETSNPNDFSIDLENVTIDQPTIINSGEGSIRIDGEEVTSSNSIINISDIVADQNVRISYQDEDGAEIFSIDRPQAELNIFDPEFYNDSNPDVATALEGKYQDPGLNIQLTETLLPELAPTGSVSILGTLTTIDVD